MNLQVASRSILLGADHVLMLVCGDWAVPTRLIEVDVDLSAPAETAKPLPVLAGSAHMRTLMPDEAVGHRLRGEVARREAEDAHTVGRGAWRSAVRYRSARPSRARASLAHQQSSHSISTTVSPRSVVQTASPTTSRSPAAAPEREPCRRGRRRTAAATGSASVRLDDLADRVRLEGMPTPRRRTTSTEGAVLKARPTVGEERRVSNGVRRHICRHRSRLTTFAKPFPRTRCAEGGRQRPARRPAVRLGRRPVRERPQRYHRPSCRHSRGGPPRRP